MSEGAIQFQPKGSAEQYDQKAEGAELLEVSVNTIKPHEAQTFSYFVRRFKTNINGVSRVG